jgi:hypothetical protein
MLTKIFDDVSEDGMEHTPKGMAHWAGSGPPGALCRNCEHFEKGKSGMGRCLKYQRMTGLRGKAFTRDCPACKYYEQKQ